SEKIISNWYEVQRNLFTSVIREHIFTNLGHGIII
ncbi:MAG: IS701 family transposase, partial [Nostoc sp.]